MINGYYLPVFCLFPTLHNNQQTKTLTPIPSNSKQINPNGVFKNFW